VQIHVWAVIMLPIYCAPCVCVKTSLSRADHISSTADVGMLF